MVSAFVRGTLLAGAMLAGLAVLGATSAMADVKAGVDAWSRADYAAAVNEWRTPAAKGDADAQFNLAQAYKLGRGVPADLAKAEELYARAAAQGHLQASDSYGLLLFQRGAHAQALPYIAKAAERGDARAQYLLGIAYFNGDNVPKDWVRAYALVSLARQANLAQATPALTQMDQYIPLDQRQKSVVLASELAAQAEANRTRQTAAFDLGTIAGTPVTGTPPPRTAVSAESAVAAAARVAGSDAPRVISPRPAAAPKPPKPTPVAAVPKPAAAVTSATTPPKPAPAPAAPAAPNGIWRVQLGAFGVPGNAEALWNRVKNRPELAGHGKILIPTGRVARLQAGGFATSADAQAACSRLSAAGFPCIVMRN